MMVTGTETGHHRRIGRTPARNPSWTLARHPW